MQGHCRNHFRMKKYEPCHTKGIPAPNLKLGTKFWRQRNIVKCFRGAKAVANHSMGCLPLGAKCNRW